MTVLGAERWLAVPDWEHCYEISNFGNGRSLSRMIAVGCRNGKISQRHYKGKPLKPIWNIHGYYHFHFTDGPKHKRYLIHSAVMLAFVGPRPEGMHVAHADGNKANNHISNLSYKTPSENARDKFLHGTMLFGENHPSAKLTDRQVEDIRHQYHVHRIPQRALANEYGVSHQHIWDIVHERRRATQAG